MTDTARKRVNEAKGACDDVPTVDWERIRAEYIAGGTSYRKLADKYGLSVDAIKRRAGRDKWCEERTKTATMVHRETVRKTVQRVSDEYADNAAVAMRIRAKLLKRLEREIDALPDSIGSESVKEIVRAEQGAGKREAMTKRWRLRDLAAAYKDLTADMDLADTDTEDIEQTRAEVYGEDEEV